MSDAIKRCYDMKGMMKVESTKMNHKVRTIPNKNSKILEEKGTARKK